MSSLFLLPNLDMLDIKNTVMVGAEAVSEFISYSDPQVVIVTSMLLSSPAISVTFFDLCARAYATGVWNAPSPMALRT